MSNKLTTFIAEQADPIYSQKQIEIDRISEVCEVATKTIPPTKYALLEQTQYQYDNTGKEKLHVLRKIDVYSIFTDTKFATGFVRAADGSSDDVEGFIRPSKNAPSGDFEVNGKTFKATPAAFNIHNYARAFSGSGDRFAFYQTESITGGFVAYQSAWTPSSITDMRFLRHPSTDPAEVSNIWWRIRPADDASAHNRIPQQWDEFDPTTKQTSNTTRTVPGFCIFQAEQDEIYRKLSPEGLPQYSKYDTDLEYESMHAYYPVYDGAGDILRGFQDQYNPTALVSQPHLFQYTIQTHFYLQQKFRVFIPPGVGLVVLKFQTAPGIKLQLKTRFGVPPTSLVSINDSNVDSESIFQILNEDGILQPEVEEQIPHSNGEVYSITQNSDPTKTIIWFKSSPTSVTADWLYCNVITDKESEQTAVLQARIKYTIRDLPAYQSWYADADWGVDGDPVLVRELLTNELSGSARGREVRGDHEILTLQGWDGKTYVNLRQGADSLNIRLTQIARSNGIYGSSFYNHQTQNQKNSLAYKTAFGEQPKTFAPVHHTPQQITDFWNSQIIPDQQRHLPVLVGYNSEQGTIRYFVMIQCVLTNTQPNYNGDTIYGGLEKQLIELDNNEGWITPPKTEQVIPSISNSKQELTPIILHLFQEITTDEFNTYKHINHMLPG